MTVDNMFREAASLPSLTAVLEQVGTILGSVPESPELKHGAGPIRSPAVLFAILHAAMVVCLLIRWRQARSTPVLRKTLLVTVAFAVSRVAHFAFAVRPLPVAGVLFAIRYTLLLLPTPLLLYAIISVFRSATRGYKTKHGFAQTLIKRWPEQAACPVPGLVYYATTRSSLGVAKWAHLFTLESHIVVLVAASLHVVTVLCSCICEPAHLALGGSRGKEQAKLIAMNLLAVLLLLTAVYRFASFFLHKVDWIVTLPAYSTLYCLPELLALSCFAILPLQAVLEDERPVANDLDPEDATERIDSDSDPEQQDMARTTGGTRSTRRSSQVWPRAEAGPVASVAEQTA
ncbi:unnamed protein product [Parajaminaea phylloscopi]